MNFNPTVFISYRQNVSGFAARGINDGLQAMGLKVFFDAETIRLGDNWFASLTQNLLESQYVVVILAPTTLESEWVRKEVEFALQHDKHIIPIFTDGLANLYDVDLRQFPEQIAALRDIQGIEYNYKRPQVTFDALKVALNVGSSAVPATPSVNPNPSAEKSSGKGFPIRGLISAVVVVLGLVFGFLALFPEQTRTDWFRSIGLLPTLTLTPSFTPTDTLIPSTDTLIPTLNATPIDKATISVQVDISATTVTIAETANAIPTSTITPSHTPELSATSVPSSPTSVPATSIPDISTPTNGQLHIFATRESLTLYVTQAVSLLGFQFGVIVDGNLQLKSLKDSFDVLILSGGQANVNDCYVYVIDGASPPLSQSCKGQVFRTTVAAADVFWYDAVTNQPRNLAIFRDGQTTGAICSAAAPNCGVTWASVAPAIPTQSPTFTSVPTRVISPTTLSTVPTIENVATKSEKNQIINGIQYVFVPDGEFNGRMVNAFSIAVYEITNAQFVKFLNLRRVNLSVEGKKLIDVNGSSVRIQYVGDQWLSAVGYDNHPAVRITWYGARDFCESVGARLPNAIEWEKAASWSPASNTTSIYPWGNSHPNTDRANFDHALFSQTAPVDAYPNGQSAIGAFNMSGNVSEWVADMQGTNRYWRGGGWDSNANEIRADYSDHASDTFTTASIGFRCAISK